MSLKKMVRKMLNELGEAVEEVSFAAEAEEGGEQRPECLWEAQRQEGAPHCWYGGGTVHPLSSDWDGLRRKRKARLRVFSWGKRRAGSVCGTPPTPFSQKLIGITRQQQQMAVMEALGGFFFFNFFFNFFKFIISVMRVGFVTYIWHGFPVLLWVIFKS